MKTPSTTPNPKDYGVSTDSRAFLGAWKKGWAWAVDGGGRSSCPYPDRRAGPHDNIITFSRGFRRHWQAGWDAFHIERNDIISRVVARRAKKR